MDGKVLQLLLFFLLVSAMVLPVRAEQPTDLDQYLQAADKSYGVGDYKQSIRMLECALADADNHGQNDLKLAKVLERLAGLYQKHTSKYAEAAALLKRALQIREHELWPDHPDVVSDRQNLASLYVRTKSFALAEPLLKQVIANREQKSGSDSPALIDDLSLLALTEGELGKQSECTSLYNRVLAIQKQRLGPYHDDVFKTLTKLAHAYCDNSQWSQAEPLLIDSITIATKNHGLYNLVTAEARRWLADLYVRENKLDQAERIYRELLSSQRKIALSPAQQSSLMIKLGHVCLLESKYEQGEAALSLAERKSCSIPEDILFERQQILRTLTGTYLAHKEFKKAETACLKSISICRKLKNRIELCEGLNTLGKIYSQQAMYDKAEAAWKESLKLQEAAPRSGSTLIGQTLVALGDVYCHKHNFTEANKCYERAIHALEQQPKDKGDLITALDRYVRSLRAAGLNAQAQIVIDRIGHLNQR